MKPVMSLTFEEKLAETIQRSEKFTPAAVWIQVKQLLTPEAVSLMAAVTGAWALAHFFGIGEIADVVLLVVGGTVAGISALDVAREMLAFVRGAANANEQGLDEAAKHFALAVAIGGVTLIAGMLSRAGPERFATHSSGPVRLPSSTPRGPGWRLQAYGKTCSHSKHARYKNTWIQ